ncbi:MULTISPECIES: gas vesicle protein [Streptomyces]|uniref:Gas vesicle protein n=1 Tax=Streptomyces maoxianensis TaxID=1459942 RepID=A0ABV9FZJ7_9ACTN|nr:gas vesicle protein [Streptomyces sp. ISL-1]
MSNRQLEGVAGGLPSSYGASESANLADILERVLDKGIVIAGDIRINLLDIELLTIKLRLVIASVDKAKEMGIDWWEDDPALSCRARRGELADGRGELADGGGELAEENERLQRRIAELESVLQTGDERRDPA